MNRRAPAIAVAVIAPLVLVAALVALRSGDGGSPRKLPVAAGGQAKGVADGAAMPAMARYGGVRYEAGPDLPALEGTAKAYKVTASVDAATAGKVAKAFGVDGEPSEQGGSFEVTSADGQRHVYVSNGGGAWFSYDSVIAGDVGSSGSSVSCSAPPIDHSVDPGFSASPTDAVCVPETTIPAPHPADFPSEDAAKATAVSALEAAGVRTAGARVEAFDEGAAWQVTVTPVVDGMAVDGMQANAAVDASGVRYASGVLGAIESFDSYPLIGTTAAIQHLNDGTDVWFGPRTMAAMDAPGCPPDASCGGVTGAEGETVTASSACSSDPTSSSADGSGASPSCPAVAPCPTVVTPDGSGAATCAFGSGPGVPACPSVAPDAVDVTTVPACIPPPSCAAATTGDGSATASCADGSPCPAPTCLPVPSVPPEPQVVTLTGATLGLTLAPSGTSDAYLLPTYVFTTADGPGPTALAIDASWLEPPAIVGQTCEKVAATGSGSDGATDGASVGCVAPDTAIRPGMSEVPCSTPGFSGPCYAGPPDSVVAVDPVGPSTTCGPPVAKADAPQPAGGGSTGAGAGCPIN